MSRFESPWSGSGQNSRLRRLVACVSVLLVFVSIVYITRGEPALTSRASSLAAPQPTIPLCCWPWFCPRVGYPDYAPHGLPDFDMRQDEWWASSSTAQDPQWTHSGPAVAADGLWYFDSEAEFILGRKYPLVTSYGTWADHDPQNVPPLITDLAGELQTSDSGTSVEGMLAGLESYAVQQGVADSVILFSVQGPSERWVVEEAANHEVVLLLLGFWQQVEEQWRRVGGHWVAANCLDPLDRLISFSDPFLDRAAAGYPGWSYGGLPADATEHNDALNVSYDQYAIQEVLVPEAHWGPVEYAGDELAAVVANSLGQNFAASLEQYGGDYVEGPAVHVAADYAVVLRPAGTCYQGPTPTATRYAIYVPIISKAALLP